MTFDPARRRFAWMVAGALLTFAVLAGVRFYRSDNQPQKSVVPTIRLAYQDRIGSALCIVAVEKDLFREAGWEVQAFRFNNGPACAEALFSGSADVATMGDTTAIIAAARSLPLTIVASHGSGEHRHRLMVAADSPIFRIEQLAGQAIGVKKGTSTYGGLLAFLAAHRLPVDAIRLIDMRPADMPEALLSGSISAFVASEPTPSLAEVQGARQLATLGGLGNSYPLLMLAGNRFLAENPDQMRALLQGLKAAARFIADHPAETVTTLARATGLPPQLVRRSMALHDYRLMLDEPVLASLQKSSEFLYSQSIIDRRPDLWQVADAGYLP